MGSNREKSNIAIAILELTFNLTTLVRSEDPGGGLYPTIWVAISTPENKIIIGYLSFDVLLGIHYTILGTLLLILINITNYLPFDVLLGTYLLYNTRYLAISTSKTIKLSIF